MKQSRCKGKKTHFQNLNYTSQCRKKNGLFYDWFINAVKKCIYRYEKECAPIFLVYKCNQMEHFRYLKKAPLCLVYKCN